MPFFLIPVRKERAFHLINRRTSFLDFFSSRSRLTDFLLCCAFLHNFHVRRALSAFPRPLALREIKLSWVKTSTESSHKFFNGLVFSSFKSGLISFAYECVAKCYSALYSDWRSVGGFQFLFLLFSDFGVGIGK